MQHFQKISSWKQAKTKFRCNQCGKNIDTSENYFHLEAHWKIKRKVDEKNFCSLNCLREWTKEDEDN